MRTFVATLTIVIVALMVREAKSQHYIDRSGNYLTSVPNPYYAANGGMMRGATWAHIVEDGGREATAQETADWQAAQDAAALAAAEAAAQAEAQAALPTVFETGIAVLDADGHHMEFVPVADGEPPLAIQISDSPLDKATRDAKVAAKLAEFAAAKAERKALKDRELDDLKAAIASAKNHKELGAAVVKWIEATEPATVEDSK